MTVLTATFAGLSIGIGSVADMPEGAECVLFVLTMTLGAYGVASWLESLTRDRARRKLRRRRRGHA